MFGFSGNSANGTYGANLSVTGLLNAGKEPLLPAAFTQGALKGLGASIGWNSRTGASASISYNVNNPDTNKPITGLGLNVDRQGSHLTGNVEGTNLFTSSSDGSFQINTNFANERLTNNAVNEAQDAFDKEMNRRETVAADTALRDAKPPLPPPYNVDPSEMTPELREKALKLLGNRMGKDNKAAGTSRTSYLDYLVGGVTDGFQNLGTALGLSGRQATGATGFVDENGKFHPRTCFTKGTLVKTIDGFKAIEEIKAGDIVYSWDEETNSYSYKKVVNTFIRQTDKIYTLTYIDGTKLETTWNHPFWIISKDGSHGDWVQAKDLKSGDLSFTSNGQTLLLASIKVEDREETVYNFEVEENHTYFVGESGVLVHNADYITKSGDNLRTIAVELEKKYGAKFSKEEILLALAKIDRDVDDETTILSKMQEMFYGENGKLILRKGLKLTITPEMFEQMTDVQRDRYLMDNPDEKTVTIWQSSASIGFINPNGELEGIGGDSGLYHERIRKGEFLRERTGWVTNIGLNSETPNLGVSLNSISVGGVTAEEYFTPDKVKGYKYGQATVEISTPYLSGGFVFKRSQNPGGSVDFADKLWGIIPIPSGTSFVYKGKAGLNFGMKTSTNRKGYGFKEGDDSSTEYDKKAKRNYLQIQVDSKTGEEDTIKQFPNRK